MPSGKRADFSINTIIGPGTFINGDVESAGFTRVDGSLRGNLGVKGRVVVGEDARLKGNVSGTAVTIGGVVSGNVLANEEVVVLSSGIVLGDIITQRIQADEGCLIHGRIMVCKTPAMWDGAIREYLDKEDIKSITAAFTPPLLPPPAAPAKEPSLENGFFAAKASPEDAPNTGKNYGES